MMGEGDITKYVGNVLAVVVSENPAALEEIASLVNVDYTPLTPITSPEDALKFDAPLIHEDGNVMARSTLQRGNADAAIRESKYVVTRKYKTGWQEHGFLEPECAVALPEGEDGILVYTSSQSVYDVRRECAKMLNVPAEKVHARAALVGGGFGGKEDMTVQPYAVLAAWLTKRPVKVKYSRQESLDYHVKRHPMTMEFTTACDEDGRLTAMKGVIIADTGAYASLGGPVLERACTHAAGPYNYQNLDLFGMSVYTNNAVSGAFRGFGVTQSCFATEQNINLLAEMVGLDPWEFRRRNCIRPGVRLPNGQLADSNCHMAECLDAVKDAYYGNKYAGLAIGFKNAGTGMGLPDTGRCMLRVEDGKIHILTSASCMGQGIGQMCLTQICDVTGLDPALFIHEPADTVRTPDAGTSTASRQTVITGEAARRAAGLLKAELDSGKTLTELEGQEFSGEFSPKTDKLGTISDNPISHVAYSYAAQVIILDENGRIEKAVSAFDIGTPVNIQAAEGQIEGGLVMGIGYGVTEKFVCEDGYPKSRFAEIGFLRADEAPEMETILIRPTEATKSPWSDGAKGCGELCMIPTAPACAAAYYRRDGEFRQSLPLKHTPYRKD
jgi:selenium-dependent xanthine dehydrogenase